MQQDFRSASSLFARADLLTAPDDHFALIYLVYHGYSLVMLGQGDAIEQCRHAGHFETHHALVHYIHALAEMRLANRAQAINAIRVGLGLDPTHRLLCQLRQQLGWRNARVIKRWSRDHWANRVLGRIRHRLLNRKTNR